MKIGNKEFDMTNNHVYVMGILNVTPDSFSDGGKYSDPDKALRHAQQMIEEGADIIDIGGESTRPYFIPVSIQEEIARVTAVIEMVKERFDVPVSVDTYKPEVMAACLEAGADLANDIWGLRHDVFNDKTNTEGRTSKMAEVVARFDVPVVIMHNDSLGRSAEDRNEELIRSYAESTGVSFERAKEQAQEDNIIMRVFSGLQDSVSIAKEHGIAEDKLILDPGIGFAKTQKENLMVLKGMKEIGEFFEYPMFLGASRKSVIGNALDLPAEEREEGTIVTSILAAEAGYKFVRVHDVKKNVRALRMIETISQV